MPNLNLFVNWRGRPYFDLKLIKGHKFCINKHKVHSFLHNNSYLDRSGLKFSPYLGFYWLKFWGAPHLESSTCNLDHFLVKLLGNLGFHGLIILCEVSKYRIVISFEWLWSIFLFMLNIMNLLAWQTLGVKNLRYYFFSLDLLVFAKVVNFDELLKP